jgi:hypothetical protein
VKGHESHEEKLKSLRERFTNAQVEFAKAKKSAALHEQRFVGKKLLEDALEHLSGAEAAVQKVVDTSKPLTQEAGAEFLVADSVTNLGEACMTQMKKTTVCEDTLFNEAKTEGRLDHGAFRAFVAKLAESLELEYIKFTDGQLEAIFKHLDGDNDGELNSSEFQQMLRARYTCTNSISVTDVFEIAKSKVLTKLEPNETIEALGAPRVNDTVGVTRVECRIVNVILLDG